MTRQRRCPAVFNSLGAIRPLACAKTVLGYRIELRLLQPGTVPPPNRRLSPTIGTVLLPEQAAEDVGRFGEEVVDLRGILAAGFGEIRTAAARRRRRSAPAPSRAAGLDRRGEVLGDRDDEADLAVVLRREHDDAAAEPIAQRVGQPAQRGLLEPVDALRNELDAGDLDAASSPRRPMPRRRRRAPPSS